MPELWDALNTAQQPQAVPPDMWRAPMGVGSPAESAGAPSGMSNLAAGLYQYLGNLAKRSFGASEEMRGGGAYNPAPAVETALATMGGPLVGVTPKAGEVAFGAGPIRAYHGSPHDFDRFDLSKIGTGEGAQAYGHGLYFAENEKVAKGYKEALSDTLVGGKPWDVNSPLHKAAAWVQDNGGNRAEALAYAEMMLKKHNDPFYGDVASLLRSKAEIPSLATGGKMYEVNINADPAQMLDWDKPLREQPTGVRNLLDENINKLKSSGQIMMPDYMRRFESGDLGGEQVYRGIASGGEKASGALNEAGIPGIKYLDQGSRGKAYTVQPTYKGEPYGDPVHFDHTHPAERWAQEQRDKGFGAEVKDTGSRNYVVFNDKLIDIMRKYGLAGAAGPPLAAGFGFPPADNEQRM